MFKHSLSHYFLQPHSFFLSMAIWLAILGVFFNINIAQAQTAATGGDPTTGPLSLNTAGVELTDKGIKVTWGLNRKPKADEKATIKVYSKKRYAGRNSELIHNATIDSSRSDGTYLIDLQGVKVDDEFTIQLIDTKTNTKLSEKKVTAATAATDASGKAVSTPDPCPQQQGGQAFEFCDTVFAPGENSRITANDYLRQFYLWAVGIAVLGTSVRLIMAGYKYVTSRGNPTEVGDAKEIILSALLGLTLLLLSFIILRFLGTNIVATP